jgi:peptidoglycan biosynthesis protein MviN/MurJ (putative lipid II flippase)
LWYKADEVNEVRTVLISLACFTALASIWLAAMDLTLKHPGYLERVWMAAFFASQSIATIIAFAMPLPRALRALTAPGAMIIAYMGSHVLLLVSRGNRDFEGYVLLIALALVLQATLTVISLFPQPHVVRNA